MELAKFLCSYDGLGYLINAVTWAVILIAIAHIVRANVRS